MRKVTRVLFVCLGNICRSPTAHGVFASLLQRRGLANLVEVDSCGTAGWHTGKAPDTRTVAAAAARGYDLSQLRARQVQRADFERCDYILAMDNSNLQALQAMCPVDYPGHLGLFLPFAPGIGMEEVPDPYYGGTEGFDEALKLVEVASEGLFQALYPQWKSSDANPYR
ncbi:MAG TPA: low molecular weight protein-tyrosine-phosphatase [Halioglobus sp.]